MTQFNSKNSVAGARASDVAAILKFLAHDFSEACGGKDLKQRLANKGFAITNGNLVTAPHGKLICPLGAI